MTRSSKLLFFCLLVLLGPMTLAQDFKRLPPEGKSIDTTVRAGLERRVSDIQGRVNVVAKTSQDTQDWLPDVEVLIRAVRLALTQNLFYRESETEIAGKLLDESERRLKAVQQGDRQLKLLGFSKDNLDKTQLLVGGFQMKRTLMS